MSFHGAPNTTNLTPSAPPYIAFSFIYHYGFFKLQPANFPLSKHVIRFHELPTDREAMQPILL